MEMIKCQSKSLIFHCYPPLYCVLISFSEFRQIFARMSYTIMDKFGNEDAVFKAIGGLLFLR